MNLRTLELEKNYWLIGENHEKNQHSLINF